MIILDLLPLGPLDYQAVDQLQRAWHRALSLPPATPDRLPTVTSPSAASSSPTSPAAASDLDDVIILAQFHPVYTAGRHTKAEHIPTQGLPVIPTDRAGSVTWHGPGQLVVYPVVRLGGEPIDSLAWIRAVEAGVLSCLQEHWHLPVERIEGRAGVWINPQTAPRPLPGSGLPPQFSGAYRKICAMGLKIASGVTLHGLALNVNIDLGQAFSGIIPCGLEDAWVASLHEFITPSPALPEAARALIAPLAQAIWPRLTASFGQELSPNAAAHLPWVQPGSWEAAWPAGFGSADSYPAASSPAASSLAASPPSSQTP